MASDGKKKHRHKQLNISGEIFIYTELFLHEYSSQKIKKIGQGKGGGEKKKKKEWVQDERVNGPGRQYHFVWYLSSGASS